MRSPVIEEASRILHGRERRSRVPGKRDDGTDDWLLVLDTTSQSP